MILVTGGAGYIGTTLVPRLLREGYELKVFDKLLFSDKQLKKSLPGPVEIIQGDIRDIKAKDIKGCDTIIHLAGISNDPTAEYDFEISMEINFKATERLAKIAKKTGVEKFIYANTCSVYYGCPENIAVDENKEISPKTPYARAKYLGEQALLKLADKKFKVISLRQGTIHGFSQRMRYDLVVNTFCKCAKETGTITVFCGGVEWRPIIDINDITEIYMKCLDKDFADNAIILNALSYNLQIKKLASMIKDALSKKINLDVNLIHGEPARSYRASNKKIKKVLGFQPRYTLFDTIDRMFRKFEQRECTDFYNPIYYNARWFEILDQVEQNLKRMGYFLRK